jgi:hypothetical protein
MTAMTAMTNRSTILLTALLIFAAPQPALADAHIDAVFDAVDGVDLRQGVVGTSAFGLRVHTFVDVTGIRQGQSTVVTQSFDFGEQPDVAAHCQRLAMVAVAKPGKYRFGIGADTNFSSSVNHGMGACNLKLVAP